MADVNNQIIKYTANGEEVALTLATIKKYLVSGNSDTVTNQELTMFLSLCKYQHLNPYLREAYLIKYGSSPATIVVGKDVFTKRANADPRYAGKQAGIIVINAKGEYIEREGGVVLPNETLIGGWAKVFVKGRETPEYVSVSFDEYAGRKKDGSLNSNWADRPCTMIRKVALVQALREAFPENFQGLYDQAEMKEVSDIKLNENAVIDTEIKENANTVEFKENNAVKVQIEEKQKPIDFETAELENETVEVTKKEVEIPDFMTMED